MLGGKSNSATCWHELSGASLCCSILDFLLSVFSVEPMKTEVPSCLMEGEDGFLELPHHLLQQTEDQLPSASYGDAGPFVSFSPPLDQEDYLWGLEEGEGVSDLFDAYDLGDLLKN